MKAREDSCRKEISAPEEAGTMAGEDINNFF
jgi:hypothetical protein